MHLIIRFLAFILKVIRALSTPIFWLIYRGKKQTVSTITDDILKISATDLARKIRKRELTSERICEAYIKRIKEVNPIINAVVEDRFESALQDARNVDAFLQTTLESEEELEKNKPLFGVPLTVKESCSVSGLSMTVGTLYRAGIKASKDGEVVSKLKAAGAIPLLVSNTPEICYSWECFNFITGRTCNPYNVTKTSGGSSGGEGALLGSGASVIGVGSDVAGSVRLPAMFNCIFGHKPSARSISVKGHFPYSTDDLYYDIFEIGPMVRYAQDLKLMMKVMCEDTIRDSLRLDEEMSLNQLKIYYRKEETNSILGAPAQKEIIAAIEKSVEYLRNKSTVIDEFTFSEIVLAPEMVYSVIGSLNDVHYVLKAENQNLFLEILKSCVGLCNYTFNLLFFYVIVFITKIVKSDGYLEKHKHLKMLFTEKLGDNGVFLYPTFSTSAPYHRQIGLSLPAVSYLAIFNTLGLPSTNVPVGFDSNGLPIGIQVVAGPNQDRLCFVVAEELEKCFGGWIPPN